ncbi:hypothetical protein ACFW2D_37240 [Streptomyces sp. NPDC058914]|uniref:hypothetical protein n=1 Tax=Streptomyces sp. NPDC058914 TaxID=3346671 RepID=UPI0036C89D06
MTVSRPGLLARLPWVAAGFLGASAGLLAWRLAVWARAHCDAGYEPDHRLALTVLLPLIVGGDCALGVGAPALGRRLVRRAPVSVRRFVPALLVVLVTVAVAWWFFAVSGTPDGYPGDSGLCPASNVPPQWPDRIPA